VTAFEYSIVRVSESGATQPWWWLRPDGQTGEAFEGMHEGEVLNALGREGWDLVAVDQAPGQLNTRSPEAGEALVTEHERAYYFRREVPQGS
jgi:hypothetical protein